MKGHNGSFEEKIRDQKKQKTKQKTKNSEVVVIQRIINNKELKEIRKWDERDQARETRSKKYVLHIIYSWNPIYKRESWYIYIYIYIVSKK